MARLDSINPINNSDYLLTIEGLNSGGTPVYFTEFSGIKLSRKSSSFNDGLSNVVRKTEGGLKEYQNVTIGKPHDPEADQVVIDFIKQNENGTPFDFRLRPIKRVSSSNGTNEFRGNKAWDLTGCRIENFTIAEGIDTSDGTKTTMLKIEFSLEAAEYK
ncbi:hypothetical protein [Picosynechococcus sp. PCC 7117]|uniref:hypothetical protein n=1 Tax=Picosynechococcus sp. PCC 7117 TaxID=195498 RepID=UPI000810EC8C|nr:hypothetical protein [Picosynechococcus sp. PCC 7117]ANV88494.1 hypothetical protein AWQ22_14060 [Picosynechococcus sp. PCC 7117]